MTFEELKQINNDKLNNYKMKINDSEEDANVKKEIEIHEKIKLILDNNPGMFFQIPMEESLKILSKLVDEEELKDTYLSLIEPDKFRELRNDFKV